MKKNVLAVTMAAVMAVTGASAVMADKTQMSEPAAQTEGGERNPFHAEVEVTTPYYSFTTPADWAGAFTLETISNETGMWVKLFYDDETDTFAGHLFSVLLTDKERYEQFPDYELLGELQDTEGNEYHVVAVFPTDIQYSRENEDGYMALFDEADAILGTITAADGCVYTGS